MNTKLLKILTEYFEKKKIIWFSTLCGYPFMKRKMCGQRVHLIVESMIKQWFSIILI